MQDPCATLGLYFMRQFCYLLLFLSIYFPSCTGQETLQCRWLLWGLQDHSDVHWPHLGEKFYWIPDWGGREESMQLPARLHADWGEDWGGNVCISSLKVLYWKPMVLCLQCDQLVEQYEPLLVQLLLQMMDPDFVCMVNHICYFISVNPDF